MTWLNPRQINVLKAKHLLQRDKEHFINRDERVHALSPEVVADMKPRQLKKRRWFVIKSIAKRLLPEQISELDPRSLRRVVAQFNQEQIQDGLTKEQIQNLPPRKIKKIAKHLSAEQIAWLTDVQIQQMFRKFNHEEFVIFTQQNPERVLSTTTPATEEPTGNRISRLFRRTHVTNNNQ